MMSGRKYTCTGPGCKNTDYIPPKEDNAQKVWLNFILKKVPKYFSPNLELCWVNFTQDSFNLRLYQMGCAAKFSFCTPVARHVH